MGAMFKSLTQGWVDLFTGGQRIPNPDPGNTSRPPADPAVVTGNYQFIIPQMFDGAGGTSGIAAVPHIPDWGVDWGQYPLNVEGLSGAFGGGSTGAVPQPGKGGSLYYDPETNAYYDLGSLAQGT